MIIMIDYFQNLRETDSQILIIKWKKEDFDSMMPADFNSFHERANSQMIFLLNTLLKPLKHVRIYEGWKIFWINWKLKEAKKNITVTN